MRCRCAPCALRDLAAIERALINSKTVIAHATAAALEVTSSLVRDWCLSQLLCVHWCPSLQKLSLQWHSCSARLECTSTTPLTFDIISRDCGAAVGGMCELATRDAAIPRNRSAHSAQRRPRGGCPRGAAAAGAHHLREPVRGANGGAVPRMGAQTCGCAGAPQNAHGTSRIDASDEPDRRRPFGWQF
jgi:hypothetical protein